MQPTKIQTVEAERDRLAAEVERLKALVPPDPNPDRPVDLTRSDEYPDGKVDSADVETCLKVIRTIRNCCLGPKVFRAQAAVLLSHAHAEIHDMVKEVAAAEAKEREGKTDG